MLLQEDTNFDTFVANAICLELQNGEMIVISHRDGSCDQWKRSWTRCWWCWNGTAKLASPILHLVLCFVEKTRTLLLYPARAANSLETNSLPCDTTRTNYLAFLCRNLDYKPHSINYAYKPGRESLMLVLSWGVHPSGCH